MAWSRRLGVRARAGRLRPCRHPCTSLVVWRRAVHPQLRPQWAGPSLRLNFCGPAKVPTPRVGRLHPLCECSPVRWQHAALSTGSACESDCRRPNCRPLEGSPPTRGRLSTADFSVCVRWQRERVSDKPTSLETPTRLAHASTCSHRRPDLQALMEQQLLQTGEEAISKLPGRAAEVQGLVSANFAAKSLADVQASFEAAFASGAPGAVNAEVVKVHTLVREQAAQASQPGQSALGRSSLCGPPPSTCSGKAPEALAAWMPTMGLWRPLVPAQSHSTCTAFHLVGGRGPQGRGDVAADQDARGGRRQQLWRRGAGLRGGRAEGARWPLDGPHCQHLLGCARCT